MLLNILLCVIFFFLGIKFKDFKVYLRKLLIKELKSADKPKEEEETQNTEEENVNIEEIDGEDLKMVFVVREDLKMGQGKQCSQVAHAAVGLCADILMGKNKYYKKCMELWDDCGSKKVVLKTNSLAHLKELYAECQKKKIHSILICDAGKTQIEPGSVTVLGIGPDDSDKINKVTGKLKLL